LPLFLFFVLTQKVKIKYTALQYFFFFVVYHFYTLFTGGGGNSQIEGFVEQGADYSIWTSG